jgi:hypothetical protein
VSELSEFDRHIRPIGEQKFEPLFLTPLISFSDSDGNTVVEIDPVAKTIVIDGDWDEAARLFIDRVNELWGVK